MSTEYHIKQIKTAFKYPWIESLANLKWNTIHQVVGKGVKPVVDSVDKKSFSDLFSFLKSLTLEESRAAFLDSSGLEAKDLESFLWCVRTRLIPRKEQLRQFIDLDNESEVENFERLKAHKLANNYELIQRGRSREGRQELADETGVPEDVILDFVNRFDVGRLSFFSGKSVRHMWNAGYRDLRDCQKATAEEMTERLLAAFDRVGLKMPNDFQKACREGAMIAGWRAMRLIVEY